MSNLLGGNSSAKSSGDSNSYNANYGNATSALGSTAAGTGGYSSLISGLLGTGNAADTAGAQAGLQNFQNSSGFQNQLAQGSAAITDNAASRGLLQSGATAKGLASYGSGLAQQSYNNYLSQLQQGATTGINATNAETAAGAVSNSTQSSKNKSKTGLGL